MTKKLLIGLLVLLTVFAFVACKNEPEVKDVPDDKVEPFSEAVMETASFGYLAYMVGDEAELDDIEYFLDEVMKIEYDDVDLDGTTLTITGVVGDNFTCNITISDVTLNDDEDQLGYSFKMDSPKDKVTYSVDLEGNFTSFNITGFDIDISALTIDGVAYKPGKVTDYMNENWEDLLPKT